KRAPLAMKPTRRAVSARRRSSARPAPSCAASMPATWLARTSCSTAAPSTQRFEFLARGSRHFVKSLALAAPGEPRIRHVCVVAILQRRGLPGQRIDACNDGVYLFVAHQDGEVQPDPARLDDILTGTDPREQRCRLVLIDVEQAVRIAARTGTATAHLNAI